MSRVAILLCSEQNESAPLFCAIASRAFDDGGFLSRSSSESLLFPLFSSQKGKANNKTFDKLKKKQADLVRETNVLLRLTNASCASGARLLNGKLGMGTTRNSSAQHARASSSFIYSLLKASSDSRKHFSRLLSRFLCTSISPSTLSARNRVHSRFAKPPSGALPFFFFIVVGTSC